MIICVRVCPLMMIKFPSLGSARAAADPPACTGPLGSGPGVRATGYPASGLGNPRSRPRPARPYPNHDCRARARRRSRKLPAAASSDRPGPPPAAARGHGPTRSGRPSDCQAARLPGALCRRRPCAMPAMTRRRSARHGTGCRSRRVLGHRKIAQLPVTVGSLSRGGYHDHCPQ
jgi:hypothetical protein